MESMCARSRGSDGRPRDVVYERALIAAAGLDWVAGWWGLFLADQPLLAYWFLAFALPFGLAAGAIWWRRWCGWALSASVVIGAISQVGAGGWRNGVALVEIASAGCALTAMLPIGRSRSVHSRDADGSKQLGVDATSSTTTRP